MYYIALKDYELASFMANRNVAEILKNRGFEPQENDHFIFHEEKYAVENLGGNALGLYSVHGGELQEVRACKHGVNTFKNPEQSFVIDDIVNRKSKVQLLAITGDAGTGKTFISIFAASQRPDTEMLIYSREAVEVGRSLGYLKGGLDEKFNPYAGGFWDNVNDLEEYVGKKGLGMKLEVQPLQFFRGRTFKNSIIFIDEAQNCSKEVLKTAITRAGSNCLVILAGSMKQIDDKHMTMFNNGLQDVIDAFRGIGLFSHVHLLRQERSELAQLADTLLS